MKRITKKVKLFYSYSHKDEDLRDEFEAHMSGLRRTGLIDEFHDRKILSGQKWEQSINRNLEIADVILFLVSCDFLNSDYCFNKEVIKSVERHNLEKCLVVPIIIRECDWEGTPFESIQGLPTDMKPVVSRHWHSTDEAFTNVVKGLKTVIRQKYFERQPLHDMPYLNSQHKDEPKQIGLTIRNTLNGDEIEIEVSENIQLQNLVDELKKERLIQQDNTYQVIKKQENQLLDLKQTLKDQGVNNQDVLLLTVSLYAG